MDGNYKTAIKAAIEGGKKIMEIYNDDEFQVEIKFDNSPLTIADKKSNNIIKKYLLDTGIPIISEENKLLEYSARKLWKECWIVDPLDGTKEFIKKNDEFTVNIALIQNNIPVFGVIYVPAQQQLYVGDVLKQKSYKAIIEEIENFQLKKINLIQIKPSIIGDKIKVVGSRSHMNQKTLNYINKLKKEYKKDIEIVSKGSSLKFCLVAEGAADVYPRFAPTMEWDTAAGQAICEAVGIQVIDKETSKSLVYNRKDLLNNYFLASNLEQF